jgi:hypothetical protein
VWDIDGLGDSAFDATFLRVELVGMAVLVGIFALKSAAEGCAAERRSA